MKFLIELSKEVISWDELKELCRLIDATDGFEYEMRSDLDVGHFCTSDCRCYPIGSIPFVNAWLSLFHNLHMTPFQIPDVLRNEEFLLRSIENVTSLEKYVNTPKFIKDAGKVKGFTFSGTILPKDLSWLPAANLYEVSDIIDIQSEYRVFVTNTVEIKGIQHYFGNSALKPDLDKLNRIVAGYANSKFAEILSSYVIDLGVVKMKDGSYDTCIIEMCPVTCVGLYGFMDKSLLSMYKESIDYYINANSSQGEFNRR